MKNLIKGPCYTYIGHLSQMECQEVVQAYAQEGRIGRSGYDIEHVIYNGFVELYGDKLHILAAKNDLEEDSAYIPAEDILALKPDFPDFPFKLDCGDRPEVRQWLKYNKCKWVGSNDLTTNYLNCKFLFIENKKVTTENDESYFVDHEHKQVTPTISVTGYTVENSHRKSEIESRLAEIEAEAKKLLEEWDLL